MALPTGLNRSRSAVVFLVTETTPGVIANHPVVGDTFGLTTTPVIGQSGNYTDTSEIGAELISMDRVLNYMEYSTFDFEYYAKPGGLTETDVSADLDTGGTPIAATAGTVTLSFTAGNNPFTEGDTIRIVTDDAKANGTYVITAISVDDAEYEVNDNTAAPSSVTTLVKITYDFAQTPEHDLLIRSFGGVKYMSSGNEGIGANTTSAYYAGNTPAAGATAAPSEANAAMAQYYLKNTVQTFTVTSRQFTDSAVQMYTATGALPTNFSVTLAKDGPVTFSSSFQANRVFYAGTADLDTSSGTGSNGISFDNSGSGTDVLTVSGPLRYANAASAIAEDVMWYHSDSAKGTQLRLMDSSGNQYPSADGKYLTVTAISGDQVTLQSNDTVAISFSAGDVAYLIPYTPVPCPDTGGILDQRKVQVFIADAPATAEETSRMLDFNPLTNDQLFHSDNSLNVTSVNFEFDRAITTPALTEMTGEEYPPASYVINEPSITGSMTLLLRPKDFQYMNALREEPRRAIGVRVGLTSGRIIEMGITSAFLEIPTPSDADGATQIDIPFTVVRGVECDDADKFFVRYR